MRSLLISTAMLFCAAHVFAQDPRAQPRVNNPGAAMPGQPGIGPRGLPNGIHQQALADVPPDTPVVTLEGVCDHAQVSRTKACKTVITRAQIDSMVEMLTPGASPDARRTFAISYARLLAVSSAAERQHLEKDPAVAAELQEQFKILRMRLLTDAFYHHMEEDAANVPASEIQKYYNEHKANFEEGEVWRLSLPRSALTTGHLNLALDASDVKVRMDEIVKRAGSGEDFNQVQQEAYTMFGITTEPPAIKASMLRRTSLRPMEAKVFDLEVGQVTQMIDSPDGFVILKLESKQYVPIEVAQQEIKPILQQQRKAEKLESAAKDVTADFNLAYLGTPTAPELFTPQEPTQLSTSRATPPDPRPRSPLRRRMPMGGQGLGGFPPAH
jgi:peptidyl-prolyl cis-trans isomerase C